MKNQKEFITELDRLAEKWKISALVQMEDQEGAIARRAYGWADGADKRPLSFQDRFCLSAYDLFFLALCYLHLFQQGKMKWSDRVSDFIPEYPYGKRITIAHLLRMESALPDELYQVRMPLLQKEKVHADLSDEEKYRREYAVKAADIPFSQVLWHLADKQPEGEPGKKEDGSVSAVFFLSEILRRHQGMNPREYLMTHIFAPLGMRDTRPGNDATVECFGCMGDDQLVSLPALSADHAFTTTLADMHRLSRVIVEKRLFSARMLQLALREKREYQGLGFCRMGEIWHADVFPGMLGNWLRIYFNFEEKMTWVILCSRDFIMRREEAHWAAFSMELRLHWQYARAYPENPEFVKITGKNVWEALTIELTQEQLSFVPDAKSCIAVSLARRQPVYMLKDHGLPAGIAALSIDRNKREYQISFLQIDHRLQGRGYGRLLLSKALEVLKTEGAEKLEIGVNRFNIPAQRLYQSVGFEAKGVYEGFMEMEMKL